MENNIERLEGLNSVKKHWDKFYDDLKEEILWYLEYQDVGSAEDEEESYDNIVSMLVSLVEDNILADYEVDCILNDLE